MKKTLPCQVCTAAELLFLRSSQTTGEKVDFLWYSVLSEAHRKSTEAGRNTIDYLMRNGYLRFLEASQIKKSCTFRISTCTVTQCKSLID